MILILSNMQKITCAAFDGYSLMMASYYQILHKLFGFSSKMSLFCFDINVFVFFVKNVHQ